MGRALVVQRTPTERGPAESVRSAWATRAVLMSKECRYRVRMAAGAEVLSGGGGGIRMRINADQRAVTLFAQRLMLEMILWCER